MGLAMGTPVVLREAKTDEEIATMLVGANRDQCIRAVFHLLDMRLLSAYQEACALAVDQHDRLLLLGGSRELMEFRLDLEARIRALEQPIEEEGKKQ